MIQPTVGRIVLYYPNTQDGGKMNLYDDSPLMAGIVHVWNERMVNLTVWDHDGRQHPMSSIDLVQPEDEIPEHNAHARWMPYQIRKTTGH